MHMLFRLSSKLMNKMRKILLVCFWFSNSTTKWGALIRKYIHLSFTKNILHRFFILDWPCLSFCCFLTVSILQSHKLYRRILVWFSFICLEIQQLLEWCNHCPPHFFLILLLFLLFSSSFSSPPHFLLLPLFFLLFLSSSFSSYSTPHFFLTCLFLPSHFILISSSSFSPSPLLWSITFRVAKQKRTIEIIFSFKSKTSKDLIKHWAAFFDRTLE